MRKAKLKKQCYYYFLISICLLNFSCHRIARPYNSDTEIRLRQPTVNYQRDQYYSGTAPYIAPQSYAPYTQPYSRGYKNPYNAPPRTYYPYYDMDQYYVPPTYYNGYYNNVEKERGNESALRP